MLISLKFFADAVSLGSISSRLNLLMMILLIGFSSLTSNLAFADSDDLPIAPLEEVPPKIKSATQLSLLDRCTNPVVISEAGAQRLGQVCLSYCETLAATVFSEVFEDQQKRDLQSCVGHNLVEIKALRPRSYSSSKYRVYDEGAEEELRYIWRAERCRRILGNAISGEPIQDRVELRHCLVYFPGQ